MTVPLTIAVSDRTLRSFTGRLPRGVELRPADETGTAVRVLWRRQHDATAWAVAALERLPDLAWLHTDTAGIDRLPLVTLRERGIAVSNASAPHAAAVGEWALAAMLLAAKGLHQTVRDSDRGRWSPRTNLLVQRRKVLVLGIGRVGITFSGLCAALGMTVVGVSRSGGAVPHVARSHGVGSPWQVELADTDFLVNCLPLTPSTRGLVDAGVLEALPPHAWFINVGRGATVAEDDLIATLCAGRLAGAVLDTTVQEPPAPDSRLWSLSNVVLSPHVAASTDRVDALTEEWFLEELGRHLAGEPLHGQVDLREGY